MAARHFDAGGRSHRLGQDPPRPALSAAGVADGESSLLVSLQETPTQLRRAIRSLGWNDGDLLAAGKFDLLYQSPVELQIDVVVDEIFQRMRHDRVRRIVIDALGDLEHGAADPGRFSDYMYALAQHLAAERVSSLFLLETESLSGSQLTGLRPGLEKTVYVVDNLLALSIVLDGELDRTVRILKTRGSAHDGRQHSMRITPRGLEVDRDRREVDP